MEKWIYDVEVMGGNFFCCTFLNVVTEEIKIFTIFDKINQLEEMCKFLDSKITLIGYNNLSYDGLIIQFMIQNKNLKNLLQEVFEFSTSVIKTERGSYNYESRKYQYPENVKYDQIDLMKVIEVNGNVPSLKLIGIILHWYRVQDLPYEFDKPVESIKECNEIVEYNLNDVLITLNLYKKILPQLELREKLSVMYGINLMSCSDSKIGDKLLGKFYTEKTGITDFQSLKEKVIEREQFVLSDCIFPDVHFQTNFLKRIKREIESTVVRKVTNYKMTKLISFAGMKYKIASGGLHSEDFPAIFKTDEEYIVRDCDFSSYYTSIMIKNNIVPEHVGQEFIEILNNITKERVAAKHTDKIKAFALKTTINAIYGKMGFSGSWFRDNRAVLKVTISGQLYLMMLIERFVLAGIEVISVNTDGIVCKIKREMENKYYEIAKSFSTEIGIGIEFTDYDVYARRDVNNYLSRKDDGEVKYKGCYTPVPEVKKGYMYPIVPKAVYKYILEGIPYEKTIMEHKDILDFCVSKKVDSKFQAEFHSNNNEDNENEEGNNDITIEILQKTNRFYISKDGGKIVKRGKEKNNLLGIFVNNKTTILNDFDEDLPFEKYELDYDFYLNEAKKLIDGMDSKPEEFKLFVDEDEDFSPPTDTKKKEEFFFKYYMLKNISDNFVDSLIWLKDNFIGDNFCDFLIFGTDNKKISSKIQTMIKLNYFVEFGNQKKLLKFYEEFTKGVNKYSVSLSEKSKEKRISLLREYWLWMKDEDFFIYEQIQNESSVIGIPFSKYPVNNFYVYIVEINDKHSSRAKLKCYKLFDGEEREVEIYKTDMIYQRKQDTEPQKLKVGDVILCKSIPKKFYKTKDESGKWIDTEKSYRLLESYYVMGENDEFFPSKTK